MLQQTQVARVIPKFEEFLARYPTLEALAAADPADVRRTWYPLGYNIRPLRLHAIARETMGRYAGRLPADEADLLALDGIGRYTAGAIRSFAFGHRAPLLDTNVRRVLGRVFHATDGRRVPDRSLWTLAARLLPRRRADDFNQALMDFGATWCTARRPRCLPCPLRRTCRAFPWSAPPRTTRETRDRGVAPGPPGRRASAPAAGSAAPARRRRRPPRGERGAR
jgi:A/G-specific adenine glycosylase